MSHSPHEKNSIAFFSVLLFKSDFTVFPCNIVIFSGILCIYFNNVFTIPHLYSKMLLKSVHNIPKYCRGGISYVFLL